MNKKSQQGSVVMVALICAALVGALFISSLGFKQLIEQQTRDENLKHTSYLLEDKIQTDLALLIREKSANGAGRLEIIDEIETKHANAAIDISGTQCGTRSCQVKVTSVLYLDAANVVTTDKNLAKKIQFEIVAERPNGSKKGAGLSKITLPIPDISDLVIAQGINSGDLICPSSKPVFQGSRIVENNNVKTLLPICAAIPLPSNATSNCAVGSNCSKAKISCNASSGFWLTGINSDISPKCERFPAGTNAPTTNISICQAGTVSNGFKFDNNFKLTDVVCGNKRGAYDFTQ